MLRTSPSLKKPEIVMTKKFEMAWMVFIALSAIGIVVFWLSGWNGHKDVAVWSFVTAGICGFIALAVKGLAALRRYNGIID